LKSTPNREAVFNPQSEQLTEKQSVVKKRTTTRAISNVRFWAKSKGFGVFVARILYIYELKIINQKNASLGWC
jgi:hypothetical protein